MRHRDAEKRSDGGVGGEHVEESEVSQRANKGSFRAGQIPWNKDLKGWHAGGRSQDTQFKKGQLGINHLPVGSVRIRRDKGIGQKRAYVKIGEPNKWKLRAVILWESSGRTIPKGLVLHHCDHNSLNDVLDNLSTLTRAGHLKAHESELRVAARQSPKRMGWGPGGKRVRWRQSWVQLEAKEFPRSGR